MSPCAAQTNIPANETGYGLRADNLAIRSAERVLDSGPYDFDCRLVLRLLQLLPVEEVEAVLVCLKVWATVLVCLYQVPLLPNLRHHRCFLKVQGDPSHDSVDSCYWKGSRSLSVRSTREGLKEKVSFVRWSRGNQSVTGTQLTHSSASVITLENENATTPLRSESFLRS